MRAKQRQENSPVTKLDSAQVGSDRQQATAEKRKKMIQFNAQAPQINGEVYLSTLPKQHDWPFLIKEAPGIANLSGLKIYLKKVRNSELSEKNSSTAPTTQMEKDLIMRKMSSRAFYLKNLRSGCEKL